MNKASEHRQHADECRSLAKQMETPEEREQLLRLADTWDRLAVEVDGAQHKSPLSVILHEHDGCCSPATGGQSRKEWVRRTPLTGPALKSTEAIPVWMAMRNTD